MMSLGGLGSLGFTAPFVLLGLLSLPALWFLVRALPPHPRSEQFPPMVLLGDLINSEPPPARTPLWLLILRFLLGALLFLALSGPVLNPIEETPGDGPVLLVVDNGWEAASRWDDRIALLDRLLNTMARENRPVVLLPTAPPPGGWRSGEGAAKPQPQAASDMRRSLMGFAPVPWSPDLQQTTEIVTQLDHDFARIFWISDGLAHPRNDDLWTALNAMGTVTLYADGTADYPVALLPLVQTGLDYSLTVVRPPRQTPARFVVQALGSDGRRLGEADAVFDEGAQTAQARIDLPRDLRNQVARIDIANGKSAGTVALLDARSGRPLVALSAGEASSAIQPLKSPLFYLRRALEPYAELTDGAPATLLDQSPSAIILADVGRMAEPVQRRLGAWVEEGGLLIRFAGPRMAAGGDDLIPVRLRSGDRAVGGALSWEEPQSLGPFNPDGPFAGLTPPETVRVSRQLLAVPDINLTDRTWARLLDGTPLVTANRRGNGWIVLFHTSANADWSSLALSGLFVDMLKRLLPLAQHRAGADQQHNGPEFLANRTVMDGFGRLGPANTDIAPISRSAFDRTSASAAHPPGYYGLAANPLALSLMSANGPITADYQFLESSRPAMDIATGSRTDRALAPLLFALMVALVALDMIASLWMRGLFNRPLTALRRAVTPAVILIAGGALFLAALPGTGHAQNTERLETGFALEATAATRIAYIRTGNAQTDTRSHAALYGLKRIMELRTAVKMGDPVGLDPAQDPLVLFPLIYWPVPPDIQSPSPDAIRALSRFLRSGGIVLMDTGVNDSASDSLGLENPVSRQALQRLLGQLDLPPLAPVDREHVLARSFYLLDEFPGRITGRTLWVTDDSVGEEARVSPILIGGHDWASAWAIDEFDHFLEPRLPGGVRQRELSFRFGVNLVMYALTGTYKADQLHLPALIERLGE